MTEDHTINTVDIKLTSDEIKAILEKLIKSSHAPLIADIVVENLRFTEVGLSQLYLAINGVRRILPFKVLDKVLVDYNTLPTWRFDEEKSKAHFKVVNDKYPAVVVAVDPYKKYPFTIAFKYFNDNGEFLDADTVCDRKYLILDDEDILEDDKPF